VPLFHVQIIGGDVLTQDDGGGVLIDVEPMTVSLSWLTKSIEQFCLNPMKWLLKGPNRTWSKTI
jgi:hypothetical protein